MEGLAMLIVAGIIFIIILLLFRAVTLWYFRINHISDTLEKILGELQLKNRNEGLKPTPKVITCASCGTVLRTGEYTCQKCGQAHREQ